MKRVIILCIILSSASCRYFVGDPEYPAPNTSREDAFVFMDSLQKEGIQPLIGYFRGCSGCINGTQTSFYLFHSIVQNTNSCQLTLFTNYDKPKTIKIFSFPAQYIIRTSETLVSDKLIISESDYRHGRYDQIIILNEGNTIDYSLNSTKTLANEGTNHVLLCDKIKSYLFGLPDHRWN
tara:strand:+ start:181 stop:717 length:537 start_codon:yes stop_codon:yes gene_type:complete